MLYIVSRQVSIQADCRTDVLCLSIEGRKLLMEAALGFPVLSLLLDPWNNLSIVYIEQNTLRALSRWSYWTSTT